MQFRRCARNCDPAFAGKSGTCPGPSSVSPAGTSRGAWARHRNSAAHPSVTASSSTGGSPCPHTDRHQPDRHHRLARPGAGGEIPGERHHYRQEADRTPRRAADRSPAADFTLRLADQSGPAGSLTEVRIRGAEANHTLVFIDGIKINDPAGDGSARFELLNADLASRIEIVRGPQSALWGSEAIGGVIAINGVDRSPAMPPPQKEGHLGSCAQVPRRRPSPTAPASPRRSAGNAPAASTASPGPATRTATTISPVASARTWKPIDNVELGAAAIVLTGRSDFDGFDPITFAHADTLDSNRNRLEAARIWVEIGNDTSDWRAQVGGTLLASSNRNFLADDPLNRTRGARADLSAQVERRFTTGPSVTASSPLPSLSARPFTHGARCQDCRPIRTAAEIMIR